VTAILIVRPEPGAGETAARAAALGLDAVVAPIFTIRALSWEPPHPNYAQAVMLTSANAARLAGPGLAAMTSLPCYAVGERTAIEARSAGFDDVKVGESDGEQLMAMMARDGVTSAFHLCGRDHKALQRRGLLLTRRIVYAADAVERLPDDAAAALAAGALVLLHSPRAARLFSSLADDARLSRAAIRVAAISGQAAKAAGAGWRQKAISRLPRDEALLELAAELCKTGPKRGTGMAE
jgi:uroporphyrinogen-III synthase